MASTLSDATVALRRTLIAGSTYATLRVVQLFFLTIFLPKKEAAVFALIVCLTTAVSKFVDAGAGAAMPRFLSMPVIKHHIGKILLIQFLFIFPMVAAWALTKLVIPGQDPGSNPQYFISVLILFLATCEAMASVGRHAIYSTLHSITLMKTEVGLKTIKVFSLPLLLWCVGLTGPVVIAHFVFFHFISSTAIVVLARRQCLSPRTQEGLDPGSEAGTTTVEKSAIINTIITPAKMAYTLSSRPFDSRRSLRTKAVPLIPSAERSEVYRGTSRDPVLNSSHSFLIPPRPITTHHHITVLKLRWQVFSTKIGKDLLSSYVLTPLFAYTYGLEYTWFFYSATTIISAIQTTIKMAITYTAAGVFAQLSNSLHNAAASRLNKILACLIGVGCSIAIGIYSIAFYYYSSPCHPGPELDEGRSGAGPTLILCFTIVTFLDMASTVYEQQFLVTGSYARFQYIRLFEYTTMAIIGIAGGKLCTMQTVAALFVLTKIAILIIVRARAQKLTELNSPPHVFTPPVHTPTVFTPAAHTTKPTSSQAPAQREGL